MKRTQEEYIAAATLTEKTVPQINYDMRRFFSILQMFVASGNLMDQMKKHIFYGKPIDPQAEENYRIAVSRHLEVLSRPAAPAERINLDPRLAHALIGIATEGTELVEALIEAAALGEADFVNIDEEIGDIDWYKLIYLDVSGSDESEIRERLMAKLKARFEASGGTMINRDLDAERKILQGGGLVDLAQVQDEAALEEVAQEAPREEATATGNA